MHGSFLPKFRGRVPVNWAVIHGERQTGASLHYMEKKPDAGDLVDQRRCPSCRMTPRPGVRQGHGGGRVVLDRSLPHLVLGTAGRANAGPQGRQLLWAAAAPRTDA